MRTSEETKLLDDALAKAQAELVNPSKDAVNPHFRSHYATLDNGLNIVRTVLSKHGISVTQPVGLEQNILILYTRIAFQGQWIQSEYPVCAFPAKQQEMGSALTYSRRYSLFSLVGIAGEEDDDANAAVTPTTAPNRKPKEPAMMDVKTSQEMRDDFIEEIVACKSEGALLEWAQKSSDARKKMLQADRVVLNETYTAQMTSIKGAE